MLGCVWKGLCTVCLHLSSSLSITRETNLKFRQAPMVTHHELTNIRKMASFQGERRDHPHIGASACPSVRPHWVWGLALARAGGVGGVLTGRLTHSLSYVPRMHVAVRTVSVIVTKCSFIRRYILFLKCDHVKASVFHCLINKAACVPGRTQGPDSQGCNREEGATGWRIGGRPRRRQGRLRALSLGRASAGASGGRPCSACGGVPAG